MPFFEPAQLMSPMERKAAIDAGIMTPEDFRPVVEKPVVAPSRGFEPSTAQKDLAKSLGITVDELILRQNAQRDAFLRARQNKASGGSINPMEHAFSSTQGRSIDQMRNDSLSQYTKGAKKWIPDFVGFPGDIADALAYAGRKVLRGQSEKSVPSLGAGAALRRYAMDRMGTAPRSSGPQMTSLEVDPREELTQLANPLFFTNPAKLMKSPGALSVLAALSGAPMAGGLGVIKPVGGNWLGGTGSVERALKGFLRNTDDEQALRAALATSGSPIGDDAFEKARAMDQWIKGPLTKYIKRDMASPNDPIRKLADQGILHFNPEWASDANIARESALGKGQPAARMGQTRMGQNWEDLTDNSVMVTSPDDIKLPSTRRDNPWLDKLSPNEPVYHMDANKPDDLGLEHLTDEVYNSLVNGELSPQQLNSGSFSVDAAVRHVHNKNEQARKAAEAMQAEELKQNLLNSSTKEYPNGYRWVELGDTKDPKALEACKKIGKSGGWCTQDDWAAGEYGSNGGKLHVLIDPEGRPHAQVQVGKPELDDDLVNNLFEEMGPSAMAKWEEQVDGANLNQSEVLQWLAQNHDDPKARSVAQRLSKEYDDPTPQITQIKPMANSWDSQMLKDRLAKDPEYRNTITPMLQDFVKSGQWSDVGDLENTGLLRHPKGYATQEEMNALAKRHFVANMGNGPDDVESPAAYADRLRRYNQDVLSDTDKAFLADFDAGNFAEGGLVNFDDLDSFLRR